MSTLINALTGANRSSSVLGAIANPPQVNPLAAIQGAAQTAGSIYDVRAKQAEQAIGGILQQSTDANGNIDYNKAHSLAAAAGPVVQMGMQKMLLNTAQLSGAQLEQTGYAQKLLGNSITAALQGDNAGLHQRVVDQAKFLLSQGMPLDRVLGGLTNLSNDPAQARQQLETIRTSLMPSGEATEQIQGTPFTYTTPGGARAGGTQSRQTGALNVPAQPGVQQGIPPESDPMVHVTTNDNVDHTVPLSQAQIWARQGIVKGGIYDTQGRPVTGTGPTPGGVPARSTGTGGPPPPPPNTTLRGSSPGSYVPPGATPQTPPAPANAPAAAPAVQPLSSTPQMSRAPWAPAAITGGAQQPPASAPNAATTAPPPSKPPQAPPAQPQSEGPPGIAGPSVATKATQEQDQALYGQSIAQMGDLNRRNIAGKAALDALELVRSTGPGTAGVSRMLAFAQANGIPLPYGSNDPNAYSSTAAYQVLAKNLLRFAQDGSKSVHSDLGLETALHSQANAEDMLPSANRHVLIQDMGMLRQNMAMTTGQDASGVGYRDRTKNFPTQTDPNAFAWDIMNPGERQAYIKQIDPNGTKNTDAYKKWASSMKIARDTGVWSSQP